MKRIIAEVFKLPSGALIPQLYCLAEDGQCDAATSLTLLLVIAESRAPSDTTLEALVLAAEEGKYVPPNSSLPDWSVNDKNVWLTAPMAEPGHVCISNELAGDYSVNDGGEPQQFKYAEFYASLNHWRAFLVRMASETKESLLGQRFEIVLP